MNVHHHPDLNFNISGANEHYRKQPHTGPAQRGAHKSESGKGVAVVLSAAEVSSVARRKAESQVGRFCWLAVTWGPVMTALPCWVAAAVSAIGAAKGRRTGASIVSGSKRGPGAKGALAKIRLATAFMLEV